MRIKVKRLLSFVLAIAVALCSLVTIPTETGAFSFSSHSSEVVYDGQYHSVDITISGLSDTDTVTYTYIDENTLETVTETEKPSFKELGVHTVTAKFNSSSISATVTIRSTLKMGAISAEPTQSSFTVNWDKVEGAQQYVVCISKQEDFTNSSTYYVSNSNTNDSDTVSYTVASSYVTTETLYYVKVAAMEKSFNYDNEQYFLYKYAAGEYSDAVTVYAGGSEQTTSTTQSATTTETSLLTTQSTMTTQTPASTEENTETTETTQIIPANELTDEEKLNEIITAFENAIESCANEFDVSQYEIERTSTLWTEIEQGLNQTLWYDSDGEYLNPFYFYVDKWNAVVTSSNIVQTINVCYNDYLDEYQTQIPQMQQEMLAVVQRILGQVDSNMTDEEKILLVHDAMIRELNYDYEDYLAENHNDIIHSAWGILSSSEHKGLCDGYAYVFHFLMYLIGVPCEVVISTDLNHAWNLVYLNGKYYHVDAAWDDLVMTSHTFDGLFTTVADKKTVYGDSNPDYCDEGYVSHAYFLQTDAQMQAYGYSNWYIYEPLSDSYI